MAAHVPRGENVALQAPPTPALIQVNVSGAVVHPGNYELDKNSRVADAVEAAGGFAAEADQNGLNLAATLENAQRLDIPYQAGFVPEEEQGYGAASQDPPATPGMDIDSAPLERSDQSPDVHPTSTITNTSTPSCSNGPVGTGAFVWPSDNHFLSGNDYGSGHPGIDIAAGKGSPVYAADAGIVTAEGNDEPGYGNVIQIDHGNGYTTVYAHLSVIGVPMCQGVYAGQKVGEAGDTGNARGVHLHFEVARDGQPINPWLVLP